MSRSTNAAILVLLSSSAAFAAGGHHDDHIPFDKIAFQAINLGILLIGIFFFIRKSIVEAFKNRRADFLAKSEQTKSALKEAEAALSGIKEKLSNLEAGEKKSLENAQHEANVLKANIIKDAEHSAEKMKKDAQLIIGNELTKARAEINAAILDQALAAATQKLSSNAQSGSAQEAAFVKQLDQVKA